jgi:hypothetical protein
MATVDPNKVGSDVTTVVKDAQAAGKEFYKSKTFWFNVAAVGASYLGYLPHAEVVVPVANLILRYFTTQPLSF